MAIVQRWMEMVRHIRIKGGPIVNRHGLFLALRRDLGFGVVPSAIVSSGLRLVTVGEYTISFVGDAGGSRGFLNQAI